MMISRPTPTPPLPRATGEGMLRRFPPKLALACCLAATLSCAPDDGRVHLRYMAWGNPQQLALEQRICDMFNAEHPNIQVDLVRVPGSAYANKMIIMLASHTAPDVMRCDHYFFPSLVRKDYFLCLDPLIAREKSFYLNDYFPIARDECQPQLHRITRMFEPDLVIKKFYHPRIMNVAK